ncbi:hypothetical protein PAECIP112173_04375 [Paenibacillus sp. JJ-100]|nr:hypothetical protein PAECIP112173_04375 [Paenibacillus sp. JJ-100]
MYMMNKIAEVGRFEVNESEGNRCGENKNYLAESAAGVHMS